MSNIQPYNIQQTVPSRGNAGGEAIIQSAIAEVQAAVVVAKQFPRSTEAVIAEVMQECQRIGLAENASYEYAKGGSKIDGPSIRLAEAISLAMGNFQSGWREIDRRMINGYPHAEIESWAWDLEKNKRERVSFMVKLCRDTKGGSYPLKDEREIYEHCANQAKRRERACILSLIPGYIIDMAVDRCRETLKSAVSEETTTKMIVSFSERFGITKGQIEKFIQRRIEAIEPGQVVRLRQIYNSLKDGMSQPNEWFEADAQAAAAAPKSATENVKEKLAARQAPSQQPEPTVKQSLQVEPVGKADELEPPLPLGLPNEEAVARAEMLITDMAGQSLSDKQKMLNDMGGSTLINQLDQVNPALKEKLINTMMGA